MKQFMRIFLLIAILVLIAGCGANEKTAETPKQSEEAAVVESFYNAIIAHDRDSIANIACADWEKDGKREVDAFAGTKPELVDFACSLKDGGDATATVSCTGKIAASYGNEVTDFELGDRIHTVVKENGEWRICGFE